MLLAAPQRFVFPPPFIRSESGLGYPLTPGVLLSFMDCGIPLGGRLAEELSRLMAVIASRGHDEGEYPCKTPPWPHQRVAYHFLRKLDCALLAAEMGLGKTKTAIDLAVARQCKLVLVVCPLTVCQVWKREIATHGEPAEVIILDSGGSKKKLKMLSGLSQNKPTWVVINYDSARIPKVIAELQKIPWDMIVADEAHRIKNHRSQTHKAMMKLRHVKYRLAMTGTPMGQLVDVFGLFRWIDPGVFGEYYGPFVSRFVRRDNPKIPQMITGYRNVEELRRRFGWLTIRFTTAETLGLPPAKIVDVPIDLPADAMEQYEQLRQELVLELEEGTILPQNALVKLLRLQQIACGHVNTDDGMLVRLHHAKTQALEDLLDAAGEQPVVVFARFVEDLAETQRLAQRMGRTYAEISGSRKDALSEGKLAEGVQIAGVQMQAGALGIDLTRSHLAVFYSLGFSLSEYDQAIARLVRPTQKSHVTIYRLLANRTVDWHVAAALNKKREVTEYVLASIREKRNASYDPLTNIVSLGIM